MYHGIFDVNFRHRKLGSVASSHRPGSAGSNACSTIAAEPQASTVPAQMDLSSVLKGWLSPWHALMLHGYATWQMLTDSQAPGVTVACARAYRCCLIFVTSEGLMLIFWRVLKRMILPTCLIFDWMRRRQGPYLACGPHRFECSRICSTISSRSVQGQPGQMGSSLECLNIMRC